MNYWILKSEPETYSWAQLVKAHSTAWTGVRNYAARLNLRKMAIGDLCFFYHSGKEKQIVGIAKVIQTAYPDPTAPGEDWTAVDIAPVEALKAPITLKTMRNTPGLATIALVKQGRLSVSPLTDNNYRTILKMSKN